MGVSQNRDVLRGSQGDLYSGEKISSLVETKCFARGKNDSSPFHGGNRGSIPLGVANQSANWRTNWRIDRDMQEGTPTHDIGLGTVGLVPLDGLALWDRADPPAHLAHPNGISESPMLLTLCLHASSTSNRKSTSICFNDGPART